MTDIVHFSKEDFIRWLKTQLEKREYMCGKRFEKKAMKEALYEILFQEQNLTVEEIEKFFIPFGQAGYLSPGKKFEIMLFVLEKEYGRSYMFVEGREDYCTVTDADVEDAYLQWITEGRIYLSDEEKKEFFVQNLMDRLGAGVLAVLKRTAPDGILLGELCPALYEWERIEERVAVCFNGMIIRLPFLELESKDELIRIIKYAVARENKGELTMMEPMLDFVREDGTCMTAIRPPAGRDWGIRILFGASGKDGTEWNV